MTFSPLLSLIQNAALLLAIVFLLDISASRWRVGSSLLQQAVIGVAAGAVGIAAMMTSWRFGPGIVFDTRSVLLAVTGLFFGALPACLAMAMTAAFRLYQGGAGAWTGVAVIVASGTIGIAWRYLRRRPLPDASWGELYLLGIVVHLAMLALMLTLPKATALKVLSTITLPVLLIYPLLTVMLGMLMVNRLRGEQLQSELCESEERYRSLIENSNDAILLTVPDGRILAANEAACRIFGRTEEELCRLGRSAVVDGTDPRLAAALEERARTGRFRG